MPTWISASTNLLFRSTSSAFNAFNAAISCSEPFWGLWAFLRSSSCSMSLYCKQLISSFICSISESFNKRAFFSSCSESFFVCITLLHCSSLSPVLISWFSPFDSSWIGASVSSSSLGVNFIFDGGLLKLVSHLSDKNLLFCFSVFDSLWISTSLNSSSSGLNPFSDGLLKLISHLDDKDLLFCISASDSFWISTSVSSSSWGLDSFFDGLLKLFSHLAAKALILTVRMDFSLICPGISLIFLSPSVAVSIHTSVHWTSFPEIVFSVVLLTNASDLCSVFFRLSIFSSFTAICDSFSARVSLSCCRSKSCPEASPITISFWFFDAMFSAISGCLVFSSNFCFKLSAPSRAASNSNSICEINTFRWLMSVSRSSRSALVTSPVAKADWSASCDSSTSDCRTLLWISFLETLSLIWPISVFKSEILTLTASSSLCAISSCDSFSKAVSFNCSTSLSLSRSRCTRFFSSPELESFFFKSVLSSSPISASFAASRSFSLSLLFASSCRAGSVVTSCWGQISSASLLLA